MRGWKRCWSHLRMFLGFPRSQPMNTKVSVGINSREVVKLF